MKIRSTTNKQKYYHHKPAFTGQRLFSVTLQKMLKLGKTEPIQGFITKMTPKDADLFEKTMHDWEHTRYGEVIISDFLNGVNYLKEIKRTPPGWLRDIKYFFIECPSELKEDQKIRALTKFDTGWDRINLRYLQSINENSKEPKIKGAGSCLIYAIGKIAEKMSKKSIFLRPDEDASEFYLKNGFYFTDIWKQDYCEIRKPDIAKILKQLEEKYNIKSLIKKQ